MHDELSLGDAIKAGVAIGKLLSKPTVQGPVKDNSERLVAALEVCGLAKTLAGTKPLRERITQLFRGPTGGLSNEDATVFASFATTIEATLSHEAGETIVVKLRRLEVSKQLLNLHSELPLTERQITLRDETLRCIECGAYRAGIVMGWNLIYDYIRSWIAADKDRLDLFNGALPANMPKIKTYDDFLAKKAPRERVVIETLRKVFGLQDVAHDLIKKLNDRNMNAHASKRVATIDAANHYIDELIAIAKEHFVDVPVTAAES